MPGLSLEKVFLNPQGSPSSSVTSTSSVWNCVSAGLEDEVSSDVPWFWRMSFKDPWWTSSRPNTHEIWIGNAKGPVHMQLSRTKANVNKNGLELIIEEKRATAWAKPPEDHHPIVVGWAIKKKCETTNQIWVCLKIGYIPNYSHLIGIMISKTIGFRDTQHFQTHPFVGSTGRIDHISRLMDLQIWLIPSGLPMEVQAAPKKGALQEIRWRENNQRRQNPSFLWSNFSIFLGFSDWVCIFCGLHHLKSIEIPSFPGDLTPLNQFFPGDSMDWFKGKFTGNHRFSHEIWGFPVKISP